MSNSHTNFFTTPDGHSSLFRMPGTKIPTFSEAVQKCIDTGDSLRLHQIELDIRHQKITPAEKMKCLETIEDAIDTMSGRTRNKTRGKAVIQSFLDSTPHNS